MKSKLILLVMLMCSTVSWALDIPEIFGDNMVLQQQANVKLWGWASKGSEVVVITEWDNKIHKVKADNKTGKWDLTISTPAASYTNYTISIAGDGERRIIRNVLVGEVWFCSGQSNMEMPLGGFWNCPVEGANEAIAHAGKYKKSIRVATIERVGAQEPQKKVKGGWEICEPANAAKFTACGYFFAQTLTDILDIPVGIINCSWGGSCVEGWMPKDILMTYPDGLTPITNNPYHAKMVMFNGMLSPLAGYTVKGFLWNQGESNVGREKEYIERFATMIRLWRKMWNQPADKLSVYAVELPPYCYGNDAGGSSGPDFRIAQHQIAQVLENYGCVSTGDLIYNHEMYQIHGCKKKEIGQRLAYMAAVRDYGVKGIACDAPEFEYLVKTEPTADDSNVIAGTRVEGQKAAGEVLQLYFTHSEDGFNRMTDIDGFEVKDAKGKWHKAVAWSASAWQNVSRRGCYIKVTCPEVSSIKAVRYAYKNFYKSTLLTVRGLPLVPFMADVK